jgi:hypothetical protein
MFNKKGVSEIVTFVLIILLVLVAIAIAWQVVIPLVKKPAEDISVGCLTIMFDLKKATYYNSTSTLSLEIRREKGAGDLTGFYWILDGKKSANPQDANSLGELETQTYDIGATEASPASVATKPGKIEIAPVVGTGKDAKMCDVKASTTTIAEVD